MSTTAIIPLSKKAAIKLARRRELYAQNREKMIAKTKRWYEKNKEWVAERSKKHRLENREVILAKRRDFYNKNREMLSKKQLVRARNNPEKAKSIFKKWSLKYKERLIAERKEKWASDVAGNRARCRNYYAKNRDSLLEYSKKWSKKNRASIRERERAYLENNRAKIYAKIAKREAAKRRLIHPDTDNSKIMGFFNSAKIATLSSGVKHSVDHIIPMAKNGWHHQDNLQVIPSSMNSEKGKKAFWLAPSMEFKDWRDVPRELWPFDLAPKYLELIEKNKGVSIRWDSAA